MCIDVWSLLGGTPFVTLTVTLASAKCLGKYGLVALARLEHRPPGNPVTMQPFRVPTLAFPPSIRGPVVP
jgi:hypothetical protein